MRSAYSPSSSRGLSTSERRPATCPHQDVVPRLVRGTHPSVVDPANKSRDDGIDTFLFDLDGTLIDTSPGLNHAVNFIRGQLGLKPLPLEVTRPIAGNGAKALLLAGNDIHENIDPLVQELFQYYKNNLHKEIILFAGIEQVLKHLDQTGIQWGIVTNRFEYLTHSLLPYLNLPSQPAVVVCGDTLARCKPYPDPVIHAYTLLKKSPENCIFIGDSLRDIQAGKAAGVKTVAATYGYIEAHDDPIAWQADYYIDSPENLISLF